MRFRDGGGSNCELPERGSVDIIGSSPAPELTPHMSRSRFNSYSVLRAMLLLTSLAFCGCIEWDRQILRYQHDPQADTLHIFQEYRGIYGADLPDKISESEKTQIQSVIDSERTFFFANWIFEVSRNPLRSRMEKLRNRAASSQRAQTQAALLEAFDPSYRIRNVDFYLDQQGRLCGLQTVAVTNVSKLIALANKAMFAAYKDTAEKNPDSKEAQANFAKVADGKWTFVDFKGNQLRVQYPLGRSVYETDYMGTPQQKASLARMKRAGIQLSYRDGVYRIVLGEPEDRVTTVSHDPYEKSYRKNLHEHLRDRVDIRKSLNPAKLAREFFR